MSALSSVDPSLSSALPPVNPATEPADIRNGNAKAKAAYQEALGFEDILVNQLSQELAATVSSPSDGSSDSSDGSDSSDSSDSSSGASGGILGSDPSTSAFASMIPQALTTSIMSDGGLGIAARLAQSLDPAIGQYNAGAPKTGAPETGAPKAGASETGAPKAGAPQSSSTGGEE